MIPTAMRRFIVFSFLAACAVSVQAGERQLIEVRFYHLRSAESASKFDGMVKNAVLPVMKGQGVGPVGVFKILESQELGPHTRVVVIPFDSLAAKLELRAAYSSDPEFWPKAKDFLQQEKGNPAYDRVESMLLLGFTGMPQLQPPASSESKQRIFELRTYKSENEIQGMLKVQMFNEGELELFRRVGLSAVFFGEAIIASNLPQLTYMLVHEDQESQKNTWQSFIDHPEWKSLKTDEKYVGIKLTISKHMLTAMDYSQIR